MSCNKVNIYDKTRVLSGDMHGSMTDVLMAALMVEPETIEEYETAVDRFIKYESDWSVFSSLRNGEDHEPYDAGIVCIDLAGRLICCDSTYSYASAEGTVRMTCDDVENDVEFHIEYQIPDDWKIVDDIQEFEWHFKQRREQRVQNMPFDTRELLYGRATLKYIAQRIAEEKDLNKDGIFSDIHAEWMMAPQENLRGRSPREVFFEKREVIECDMVSRMHEWSITGSSPKPLSIKTHAYKYAGYGSHEFVVHYDLFRHLLGIAADRREADPNNDIETEIEALAKARDEWMDSPVDDYAPRTPRFIVEQERRRMHITMSAHEVLIDEDCPCCVAMSEDFSTPMFWMLDGCNMDDRFEFSHYRTFEEWQDEQKRYEEYTKEFNKTQIIGEPFWDEIEEEPF